MSCMSDTPLCPCGSTTTLLTAPQSKFLHHYVMCEDTGKIIGDLMQSLSAPAPPSPEEQRAIIESVLSKEYTYTDGYYFCNVCDDCDEPYEGSEQAEECYKNCSRSLGDLICSGCEMPAPEHSNMSGLPTGWTWLDPDHGIAACPPCQNAWETDNPEAPLDSWPPQQPPHGGRLN